MNLLGKIGLFILTSTLLTPAVALADAFYLEFVMGVALESDSDIVVTDRLEKTLVRLDTNKDFTEFSDDMDGSSWAQPLLVEVDSVGDLIVTDFDENWQLVRVNPTSGAHTVLSDDDLNDGALVGKPGDVVVDDSGASDTYLITDKDEVQIAEIDPGNGDATQVADSNLGGGVTMSAPSGMAIDADDEIVWVVDDVNDAIYEIEITGPTIGNGEILSDANNGGPSGVTFDTPRTIAVGKDDSGADILFVIDAMYDGGDPAIVMVDPGTGQTRGDRTILSDESNGKGPYLVNPRAVKVEPGNGGDLIVTDRDLGDGVVLRIAQVDDATREAGDREIIRNSVDLPDLEVTVSGLCTDPDGADVTFDITKGSHFAASSAIDILGSVDTGVKQYTVPSGDCAGLQLDVGDDAAPVSTPTLLTSITIATDGTGSATMTGKKTNCGELYVQGFDRRTCELTDAEPIDD